MRVSSAWPTSANRWCSQTKAGANRPDESGRHVKVLNGGSLQGDRPHEAKPIGDEEGRLATLGLACLTGLQPPAGLEGWQHRLDQRPLGIAQIAWIT
jgi:hypothetical protein